MTYTKLKNITLRSQTQKDCIWCDTVCMKHPSWVIHRDETRVVVHNWGNGGQVVTT